MQLVFPSSLLLCFIFGSVCLSGNLSAQNQEARALVADLSQDIALMDRQIRGLKLDIEILKDNQAETLNKSSVRALELKLNQMSNDLNILKKAVSAQEKRIKQAILNEVAEQMDAYVSQINSQIAFTESQVKSADVKKVFSDSYPKSGVSYEVQSGDTLSQIAAQFGSKVQYIQDANQINDPARDLRVGDIIFIPLTED
ncbi:MAG: LysM peptidoglycan-binding domain-containing protein [Opitutae bacterium]|jgi:LysM repeat protein|nr:LysM peptidoglycan-binding domain-containing protein [Opitutae bacterium]